MKNKDFIKIGAKVKWNDPGIDDYEIMDRLGVIDREFEIYAINGEIICISDGGTEAEVFANELEPYVNKPHKATLIFGSEACELWDDESDTPVEELTECGEVMDVEFETKAELDAYLAGIADARDWNDVVCVNRVPLPVTKIYTTNL